MQQVLPLVPAFVGTTTRDHMCIDSPAAGGFTPVDHFTDLTRLFRLLAVVHQAPSQTRSMFCYQFLGVNLNA